VKRSATLSYADFRHTASAVIRQSFADAIFWASLVTCVLAQVAILRSALLAPISPSSDPEVPRPRRSVEVAWTMVPAIGLLLLLSATWDAMRTGRPDPAGPPASATTAR
jgi:hypothetical protein